MRGGDTVRRAAGSLRQAKARTLLTSLAIAVGAFTLTIALAAGEGARQYTEKIITSNIDPQMLLVVKDRSLFGGGDGAMSLGGAGLSEYSENATQFGGITIDSLSANDVDTIKRHPDITTVTPTYFVNAQYVTFSQKAGTRYTSDVTVYDTTVRPEIDAGTLPDDRQQIADNEVIVPAKYLEKLGIDNHQGFIGSKVTLRLAKPPQQLDESEIQDALLRGGPAALQDLTRTETRDVTLKVRAISKQSAMSMSASNALFISENTARDLSEFLTKGTDQYRSYVSVMAMVRGGVDPMSVKAALEDEGLSSMTAKDLQGLLFNVVNMIQMIVIGFGVLALIASVFGIINTQYISVLERTQQIGLMKALGMRRRDVGRLFRLEAAWLGLLGGVLGALLAVAVGAVLNPWLTDTLNLGEGNALLIFQLLPITLLVVGLMLIAVLAGYFPSRKASKLDPIEALRTE